MSDYIVVKIYSVGVWNASLQAFLTAASTALKFTPLEFETTRPLKAFKRQTKLKFTPLEFETGIYWLILDIILVKIYSVGVWNQARERKIYTR